jgi:hypothetical protein
MNQYKANPLINIKRRIHYALRNGNLPKEATLLEYGSNKDVDNNKARLILYFLTFCASSAIRRE